MIFIKIIEMPFLAILGLICIIQVSNGVKPGTCPTAPPGTVTTCIAACSVDEQCQGYQKCCHYGCGIRCMNPISNGQKPGRCPIPPQGVITTCDVTCENDDSCRGFQKCCNYGCRVACYNPV